jgi:hypothetical protein
MKPNPAKKSLRFGKFIALVYDAYFPHACDYQGGTDADHIPVIPGNNFVPDASHSGESSLQYPKPDDVNMTPITIRPFSALRISSKNQLSK